MHGYDGGRARPSRSVRPPPPSHGVSIASDSSRAASGKMNCAAWSGSTWLCRTPSSMSSSDVNRVESSPRTKTRIQRILTQHCRTAYADTQGQSHKPLEVVLCTLCICALYAFVGFVWNVCSLHRSTAGERQFAVAHSVGSVRSLLHPGANRWVGNNQPALEDCSKSFKLFQLSYTVMVHVQFVVFDRT